MYGNCEETWNNSEVVMAGYLTKSPPGAAPPMSQWRRRWFVLRDSSRVYPLAERHIRMEYYQNEGDAKKLCDPKGVIELKNCTRVSSVARLKGHNYVFDICTKDRTYHIAAETPQEKYEWMKTLNELLFTTANDVQDLEKAEMLRQKSISKSPAERQHSWGDLSAPDRRRPTSCFINSDTKCIDETSPVIARKFQVGEYKKRPLPPTPNIPPGSNTLQHSGPSHPAHHQKQQISSTVANESPPPLPVPKPRSRNSTESNPTHPTSTPSPTLVTSSLPVGDISIHRPQPAYENVPPKQRAMQDVVDQPPPPPVRTRHRTSQEDPPQPQQKSHDIHLTAVSPHPILSPHPSPHPSPSPHPPPHPHSSTRNPSYENIPKPVATHPVPLPPQHSYEDIDVEDSIHKSLIANYENRSMSKNISGDKIIFLDQDVYADPNDDNYADIDQDLYTDPDVEVDIGNTYLYEDPSLPEASNYEVPVNIKTSPVPPKSKPLKNSNKPVSLSSGLNDTPPAPPPRAGRLNRKGSIHSSLINLSDEQLYSELQDAETTRPDSDDEHYGRLIRFGARERRFSDPEVIPISPRSHSSSPLFFSQSKHKMASPPPIPPPYSSSRAQQQQKGYYENTGIAMSRPNGYT